MPQAQDGFSELMLARRRVRAEAPAGRRQRLTELARSTHRIVRRTVRGRGLRVAPNAQPRGRSSAHPIDTREETRRQLALNVNLLDRNLR